MTGKIGTYDMMMWLQKLKQSGINQYKYGDLPANLKHYGFHRKAVSCKAVIPIKRFQGSTLYAIPEGIMKYTNSSQKIFPLNGGVL